MRPPTLARGRRRPRPTRPALLLTTILAVGVLGGCSGPDGTAGPLPAAFDDGVPSPTGEVVLTLEGPDGAVDWDLATLEMLDVTELTVLEPFVTEELTFTGPLWRDVLAASGIGADQGSAVLVALDDYTITLTTDPDELDGVVLATTDGGEPIPVERGGPIRIVFPEGSALGENLNNWIWQLRSGIAG